MNFLVIGLGSMGKRRIRCLKALGEEQISGFDMRQDRCNEAAEKYGIKTYTGFDEAVGNASPDALVISVPPDKHMMYIRYAIDHDLHFFVEASVIDEGMDEAIRDAARKNITAAPSSTLSFHPGIRMIKDIIRSGELGKVSNVLYHVGQYLPDWHTYEKVSDYYVSNPATGGAREIVPFELTWLISIFGWPVRVCAQYRKTIEIEGAEYIDDTYNMLLDYRSYMASITVDVVSRYATRKLTVNGSKKQLTWSWDENKVRIYDPEKEEWEERSYEMKSSEAGYNQNIGENMYIEELGAFVASAKGKGIFPNTLADDHRVLKLLYAAEQSDDTARFISL